MTPAKSDVQYCEIAQHHFVITNMSNHHQSLLISLFFLILLLLQIDSLVILVWKSVFHAHFHVPDT